MSVEIIKNQLKDEVTSPDGGVILSAEARTVKQLDRDLGDQLSDYTYEQGMRLPKGTQVIRSQIRRVGPLVIKKIPLSSKILVT